MGVERSLSMGISFAYIVVIVARVYLHAYRIRFSWIWRITIKRAYKVQRW